MDLLAFKNQLKDFLELSLDRCMQSVNARSGSIYIFDFEKKELVLGVSRSEKKQCLEGSKARLGERVIGRVALERKALLVENIDKEPSFNLLPKFNYRSKSFLSVPLEFSGDLIGVLNLTDKSTGNVFNVDDLRTILMVSKHVGIALHSLINYLEKQKEINEELLRVLGDLKDANERYKKFSSLGKFAGGLVHEINNPLDGVIRYINLSLDTAGEDSVSKEYLLEAKKGLSRIAQFVRSLLNFSWGLSADGKDLDIERMVEESLFYLSHQFKAYTIAVEKSVAKSLPAIPDYGLKIVINNIIKNAIEAMKENGGRLKIAVRKSEDCVDIAISDTGKGIPALIKEKIFDPFFTTKKMGEGSGLGLAIAYEIVERYQGAISVESSEGKGATFRIKIPIQQKVLLEKSRT